MKDSQKKEWHVEFIQPVVPKSVITIWKVFYWPEHTLIHSQRNNNLLFL